MRKNRMMRAASALLVAVLLTTSTISGTFAKYVTEASGQDEARVALWGVTATSVTSDIFTKTYVDEDNDTGFGNTVVSTVDVVAPGTTSTGDTIFKITGKPEVAVAVDVKVTDKNGAAIVDVLVPGGTYIDYTEAVGNDGAGNPYYDTFALSGDYYPVVYTLKNGAGNTLAEGNLAVIQTYLEGLSGNYQAGTNLATDMIPGTDGTYKLSWKWAFEKGTTEEEKAMYDAADTLLGNITAGLSAPVAGVVTNIDFMVKITVTQID